jgi:hypothetical protein
MATNTTAIVNLLRPGLKDVFGDLPGYRPEWPEIFESGTSDKAVEYEVEMKFLGLGQIKNEGGPIAMDTMGQRIVTSYVNRYVALQFQITAQAVADNLYKDKFPMMVKSLKKSMAITKEILGASVLNNAFNNNFPIGDGVSLCNTQHPIDNGYVANTPTIQADLNEASLEQALIAISLFKDQAGLISMVLPEKLVVPPQGDFVASRLLNSQFRVGTPNNDINAINYGSRIPKGYVVNHFLTLPNSWFVLTNCEGLKHYVREKIRTDMWSDFSTENIMAKAVERYSFGCSNFRSIYGSNGP